MSVLAASQPAGERRDVVESYFGGLQSSELYTAYDIASQIAGRKPLAGTVVIIPVAAHQEAPQIANTLAQYAKQKTDRPFSIVLGLNCPDNKIHDPDTQACISEVKEAEKRHPNLDVRTSFRTYKEPIIGRIRRELWNGVLQSALDHDQIDSKRTVIGLNQDIDLVSMWPTTIRTIQQEYDWLGKSGQVQPVTGMHMTHGASYKHPNINRAVQWHDFTLRQRGETFEAALIVPAEMYAIAGGFDDKTSLGEVFTRSKSPHYIIRGTHAVTSPRRYLERVHIDGLAVWSEGNFSAEDAYRTTEDFPDISLERSLDLIDKTIIGAAAEIGRHTISRVLADCHRIKRVDPELFEGCMYDSDFIQKLLTQRLSRKRIVSARVLDLLTGSSKFGEKLTGALTMDMPAMAQRMHDVITKPLEPGQKTVKIKMQ